MKVVKLILGTLFGLATMSAAIDLGSNILTSDSSTRGTTEIAASCAATAILGLITVLFARSAFSKQQHHSAVDD